MTHLRILFLEEADEWVGEECTSDKIAGTTSASLQESLPRTYLAARDLLQLAEDILPSDCDRRIRAFLAYHYPLLFDIAMAAHEP